MHLKIKLYANMCTWEGNEHLQYSCCHLQNSLNNLILCQKAPGETIRTVTLVFTNTHTKDRALTLPKYFIFLGPKTDKAQKCTGMILGTQVFVLLSQALFCFYKREKRKKCVFSESSFFAPFPPAHLP